MAPAQDATTVVVGEVNGHSKKQNSDSASASGSSTSSDDSSRQKKRRNRNRNRKGGKKNTLPNGHHGAFEKRRDSRAARDPRDEPLPKKRATQSRTQSPSPIFDSDGLSRPSRGTRQRIDENADEAEQRLVKMRGAVRTLLECIGEDPDREGLLATPDRYAKALLELTRGYTVNVNSIVNNAKFDEDHNELIIVKDIEIQSLCEHHLVPFIGKMHIGYIPNNTVLGLSKFARIAEMYARRLQIQERLTKEVAHAIMEILKPQGVAVVMESSHLCMVMRGVQKTSSTTITSCVLGCFERKSKTRNEFMSLIGVNR